MSTENGDSNGGAVGVRTGSGSGAGTTAAGAGAGAASVRIETFGVPAECCAAPDFTDISGFESGALSLDVSGTGDVRGSASRFDALTLDVSGAVNVDLGDVPVANAEVDISGAGNVTLRMAGGRLTGELSGAANLNYYGTVSEASVETSGFVNLRRRN